MPGIFLAAAKLNGPSRQIGHRPEAIDFYINYIFRIPVMLCVPAYATGMHNMLANLLHVDS